MPVTDPPLAPAARLGGPADTLPNEDVQAFVAEQLAGVELDGRSLCVLVPDATRSCPLPLLLEAVHGAVHGRASAVTVLVALGTHAAMTEEQLAGHLGYDLGALRQRYPGIEVRNHEWWQPDTLTSVGRTSADRIAELSEGRLQREVDVRLNRAVVENDVTLIVGPVFPP